MHVKFCSVMKEVDRSDTEWVAWRIASGINMDGGGFFRIVRDLMLARFCLLCCCLPVLGEEDRSQWNEVQWSNHLADSLHADAEYRLPDGSRIDIYQPGVCAWEVEWCSKWPEAFGQAAFYAASTDTAPGIWILKKGKEDDEDYLQFLATLQFYRSQGVRIKFQVTEVGK